jgi:hypothetical protein
VKDGRDLEDALHADDRMRLGRPRLDHWQLTMAQPKPGAVVGWL